MLASELLPHNATNDRNRKPRPIRWAGTLAVGVLLLAACGRGDTAADANPSGDAASTSTSYYSPLNEYMSPEGAGDDFDQEEWEAKDRQVQELVATCMKGQGFNYLPQDTSSYAYVSDGDENLSERDMIAKYGYWVTTQLDMQPEPSQMPADPNQVAYEAMSDSERTAYDEALWGSGAGMMATSSAAAGEVEAPEATASAVSTTDPADSQVADTAGSEAVTTDVASSVEAPVSIGADEPMPESYAVPTTPEEKGCYGVAQEEIYGDQMYGNNIDYDEFQDLFDAQNEMYMSIDDDPRLAGAVAAWSTCVEGKGYPGFTEIQAPSMDVNRQYAELIGMQINEYEDGGWGMEPAEGLEMTEPVDPDPAKLATLKDYEIALALADFDCKGDYNAIAEEVRISLEEQFVQDHKAELERYRDSINSGGN